ncbi:MAG TPA: phytoene desaturase [Cytophagales bacterium]|jgi:phytoene desaturase|nr:phytoene desaturase [Cytophagales bacterium]
MKGSKGKVGIIGAGIAGLSSAVRLASRGYLVEVYERNSYPGGKLSEIEKGGYRFDAGPSLFTMPHLVDELFELAGKNPKDYFQYEKIDITCNYFYEDGLRLSAYADNNRFAEEIENKTGEPARKVLDLLENSAYLYDSLAELFIFRSLHKPSTFLNKHALKAYFRIPFLKFFDTLHSANARSFKDPRIIQLFDRYATYNGSDPYQTPASMRIIPHLEYNIGAFFPKGGMYHITDSIYRLAKDLGVKFFFNSDVKKIITRNGEAIGIQVNETRLLFEKVVCNMDMVNAYKYLLKEEKQPQKLMRQPKSSSALIFYWGIKRSFPELDLHNIFFSSDYQTEFRHIFEYKTIYDDPTVYINITSKYNPSDAPEGSENWFTMINVPHNSGQDWDEMIREARVHIIKKVSRLLNVDIEPLIEVEEVLEPRTIESKTSSANGALYGNSSNNKYAAFLRHPNYSPHLKNLYFCGGSVHPGGGIPLSISSAKIVSDYID